MNFFKSIIFSIVIASFACANVSAMQNNQTNGMNAAEQTLVSTYKGLLSALGAAGFYEAGNGLLLSASFDAIRANFCWSELCVLNRTLDMTLKLGASTACYTAAFVLLCATISNFVKAVQPVDNN